MATSGVLAVLLAALGVFQFTGPTADVQTTRFSVRIESGSMSGLALSPDGTQLAFVTGRGYGQLWVRSVDSTGARLLAGIEEARAQFWSPDGRSVGFFTVGELKVIDLAAGASPRTVLRVEFRGINSAAYGGTWNQDDVILFGDSTGGLFRVSANGGEPTAVTARDASPGEMDHRWPQFLPDGDHFIFLGGTDAGDEPRGVYVGSLDEGTTEPLGLPTGHMARYAAPGYLLFERSGSLMTQSFDPERRLLTGEPVRAVEAVFQDVVRDWVGFSTSDQGDLAFVGADSSTPNQLRWFDRAGADLGTVGQPGNYYDPALSPDETQIAVERDGDIWLLDLSRGTEQRLTVDPMPDRFPTWSPDGDRVAFTSMRERRPGDLYVSDSAGSGVPQLLLESGAFKLPYDWSADGAFLTYSAQSAGSAFDIWMLPMSGDRQPTSFLETPFTESSPMLSPDGRWVAYTSPRSGEYQVYARRVASGDCLRQLSVDGGDNPQWRGDGRELYYRSPDDMVMAVAISETNNELEVGIPQPLFRMALRTEPQRSRFDVTADGQRFLVNTRVDGARSAPITWVLNWMEELEQ